MKIAVHVPVYDPNGAPKIKIMIKKNIKSFKDLNFKPYPNGRIGLSARLFFENGYGVYVARFKSLLGSGYLSYTENENQWEIAVLKGNNENSEPCYDTPITTGVLGYLTEEDVNTIMKDIQKLPPCE